MLSGANSQVFSLYELAQEDFSTAMSAVQVLYFFFLSTGPHALIHKGLSRGHQWRQIPRGNVCLFRMQLSHTVHVR